LTTPREEQEGEKDASGNKICHAETGARTGGQEQKKTASLSRPSQPWKRIEGERAALGKGRGNERPQDAQAVKRETERPRSRHSEAKRGGGVDGKTTSGGEASEDELGSRLEISRPSRRSEISTADVHAPSASKWKILGQNHEWQDGLCNLERGNVVQTVVSGAERLAERGGPRARNGERHILSQLKPRGSSKTEAARRAQAIALGGRSGR